jgi:hypothetical protein
MKVSIEFCIWLQRNFDAVIEHLPEWHEGKPEPTLPVPIAVQAVRPPAMELETEQYRRLIQAMKKSNEADRKKSWWPY